MFLFSISLKNVSKSIHIHNAVFAFLLSAIISHAQITLQSQTTTFDNGDYDIIAYIPGYGDPHFKPSNDGWGTLGLSDKRWWDIRGFYIYYTMGIYQQSDLRLKENIISIETSIDKIKRLRPVMYDIRASVFDNVDESKKPDLLNRSKGRMGLIAQEVKEVLPQIVNYDNSKDVYTVNYVEIIPLLIGAIQEQQKQIEILNSKLGIK